MTIPARAKKRETLAFAPSDLDLSGVLHRLRPLETVDALLVHCSATPPTHDWDVLKMDRVHRQRGFTCVGYHFVLPRPGGIQEGRPMDRMGAHCRAEGYNHRSLGICLVGGVSSTPVEHVPGSPWNGSDAEANFTDAQMRDLSRLLDFLTDRYPEAVVKGHRDVRGVRKACPSFDVARWLRTGENPTSVD